MNPDYPYKFGFMRWVILFMVVLAWMFASPASGQVKTRKVTVEKGQQVILQDTSFITRKDTTFILDDNDVKNIRIRDDPFAKSVLFYDSLGDRASSNKMTKEIYDLVIKKKKRKEKLVSLIVKSEEIFQPYEGFIIGSITIKTVDLLEGSVIDTLEKASTKFGKFINKVHKDTRPAIIRNNLLFEVGDVLDPFELADNERILRQFKTLRDARIYVSQSKGNPNIADVVVVTQDVSSIGVSGDYSSLKKFRIDVFDINILGYAKQLQLSYFRSSSYTPQNGYEITLREPNLLNSFTQAELQYTDNYLRQRIRFSADRDFFAPNIKYAGGIEVYQTREKFYFEDYDTLEIPYTENNIDFWGGRSFEFRKRFNMIFTARLDMHDFARKPFVSSDSNSFFYDRNFVLGSVWLTKRNFLKSLRIRGFGRTEDIPTGGAASILMGTEINEFTDRSYFEVGGTYGNYFTRIGYVNLSLAAGSFFKRGKSEDGVLAVTGNYFSDLIKIRKIQLRQFVYVTYTRGYNRVLDRTVSLPGKWRDENNLSPLGNKKITVGLESVYFMPWYFYGFQFAMFYRVDLILLTYNGGLFDKKSQFYAIRGGARVLNENLVLPSFTVELGYFGKSQLYGAAWEVKFSTTLPNLFGTSQVFKPQVRSFN